MAPSHVNAFTADEVQRYSRHLILPEFGAKAQKKLKAARVLVIGAGGLGSPAALYLAAAGVGSLGLIDFDTVDVSNLQRQVLHGTGDVGRLKVDSARDRLFQINPGTHLNTYAERLTAHNAVSLFSEYDVVLDGTDTFATRYLINDACLLAGKPNVSASVFRFEGQLSVFGVKGGPCYRCLYAEAPVAGVVPSCGEGGVLGVVPGVIGTLQATEAMKLITGIGETLAGRLLSFDALSMRFRQFQIVANPDCVGCGVNRRDALTDDDVYCAVTVPAVPEVSPRWVLEHWKSVTLLDVREPGEREIADLPGAVGIPYGALESRVHELQVDRDLVVFCRVGERSARAVALLRRLGFDRSFNLAGGLRRWGEEISAEDIALVG
jgi:molybdopterin/thiamine biosynthesis adenylyltransferase/rhodanese-related sulfurtransferase